MGLDRAGRLTNQAALRLEGEAMGPRVAAV